MPVRVRLTYKDLESLPEDGKRYELHAGEVFVTAAPRVDHQRLVHGIGNRLEEYVVPRNLGTVDYGVDVYFAEDTTYTPDLVFVAAAHDARITEKYIRGAPDLIVEVLSPSAEVRDRGIKLQDYARFGVPEYWVFDGVARAAEVYVLRGTGYDLLGRFGENDTLRSEVLPGLEIPLAEVWPEPLPEE